MIHFLGVILDGFGQIICSRCEQDLADDPSVDIVFVCPVHGQTIRCAVCGVSAADAEETAPEKLAQEEITSASRRHIR